MPRYLYKCKNCGYVEEFILRVEDRNMFEGRECPKCLSLGLKRDVAGERANRVVWREEDWEHIDVEPIRISSREQLFRECEKRGLWPVGVDKWPKPPKTKY